MKLNKLLLTIAGLAGALLAPAAHAGTLTFSPGSQSLLLGNPASIDVIAQGLGNGSTPALAAYDITVFFNSSILLPTGVTFSSRLGDPNDNLQTLTFNQYVYSGPNVVGIQLQNISFLDAPSLFALQSAGPGGFTLATLTFNTIAPGTSAMSLGFGSASDENANDLSLTASDTASIEVTGKSSVPEPGTYALGGAGFLLLGCVRRFRGRN